MDRSRNEGLPATGAPGLLTARGDTFSIIALSCDPAAEHSRHVRAFNRVLQTTFIDAEFQTTRDYPFVLKRELALADALLAQFELICCDIVSVFIKDTVMSNADPAYLVELYQTLTRSSEFEPVSLIVRSVPQAETGDAFVRQFLSDDPFRGPQSIVATHKKARIMRHWANKIGAVVA